MVVLSGGAVSCERGTPVITDFPSGQLQGGSRINMALQKDGTPHDGLQPFHQKSICLKKSNLGPYVVKIGHLTPQMSISMKSSQPAV